MNIAPALVIAVSALLIFTVLGLIVTNSHKSFPNLTVGETKVGNMRMADILDTLKESGWESRGTRKLTVITFCGVSEEISPVESGVISDVLSAAESAVSYGKDRNIYSNLFRYISCLFTSVDINDLTSTANMEYIGAKADAIQSSLNSSLGVDSYVIDEETCELVIIKGYETGIPLDKSLLEEEIISALESGEQELDFYETAAAVSSPDVDALHTLVCASPIPASFSTDGSHTIIADKPGYDFDVETAKSLIDPAGAGCEIRIPLSVSYSDINRDYLESMMYRHLLGAMTTKYNNSGENRSSNVRLATSLVNGTVIFPGEVFSFNETVGKRTEAAGFLLAPAYAGYDDIQEEIGGGVCQVSTGIYASALYAFLSIKSHTCHIYPPNYIQLGTDATVSIPESGREIDLKIENSKSWPIKIVGYCEETTDENGKPYKTVTIEIWGTLEDDDLMPIEFDNRYADIYDYDRKIAPAYEGREGYHLLFTHDETEFEDENGKGLRTLTYMRIYDSNENLVNKIILNPMYSFGYGMDTYYYMG